MWGDRPGPNYVAEKLAEFRQDWEDELAHVRDFAAAYPDAVIAAKPAKAQASAA